MAKKNQHWEVEFRMLTEDEWMWKNLPFTLKFTDKESAERKYKKSSMMSSRMGTDGGQVAGTLIPTK